MLTGTTTITAEAHKTCSFTCACMQKQFDFYPTLKVHLKVLSDHFLPSDDTCIITPWAHLFGLSLKGFSKMLLMAVKSIALKDALPSETCTWKITADPRIRSCFVRTNIPHVCQYMHLVDGKFRKLRTFSGQNKYAYLTHPCHGFKIVPPRQQHHWLNQGLN